MPVLKSVILSAVLGDLVGGGAEIGILGDVLCVGTDGLHKFANNDLAV